jgi:hypothetical protein
MFSGAFRALFHRPGSLPRIPPPTLLFTAFTENETALSLRQNGLFVKGEFLPGYAIFVTAT